MYIDTHCHLDDEKLSPIGRVVEEFRRDGVSRVINVACNEKSSQFGKAISEKFAEIYFASGFHPSDVAGYNATTREKIVECAKSEKCVAIGEIGLDYYWDDSQKELQKQVFVEQIEIANFLSLPISVHSRNATEDTLKILRENKAIYGGVMHCFSGSIETAKILLNSNFYISFAGPVTFKNSKNLPEIASFLPSDRILTETDSPYLAPTPFRGTVNSPKNVSLITNFLANLRNEDEQSFASSVMQNAKNLFKKLK